MSEHHQAHRATRRSRSWRRSAKLVAVLALAAGSALVSSGPQASAFSAGSFQGDQVRGRAFGAAGSVLNPGADPASPSDDISVSIGEVAVQSMSCNPALGTQVSKSADEMTSNLNLVAGLTVPLPNVTVPLARTGELKQTGYATAGASQADAFERSVVQSVNLLDGRIVADVVQADAWTTHDATGYHHHSTIQDGIRYEDHGAFTDPANSWDPRTDTTFANLFIDADGPGGLGPVAMDPRVKPNTVVKLSNVGYVVLNEQKLAGTKYPNPLDPRYPRGAFSFSGVDVNAIHVYLFDDAATPIKESFFGYNGDITVAHAETRVQPAPGRLSGFAYGSRGTVDPFLVSGPQAIVGLPCGGTNGADRNRTQAATQVAAPSNARGVTTLLRTGTMSSTVNGLIRFDSDNPYSLSTEDIQTVRLLTATDGTSRLTADVLHVVARTDGTPTAVTSSAAGTSFLNLVVDPDGPGGAAPMALSATPPPNTKIPLDGIGELILNEQNCSDHPDPSLSQKRCTSLRADGTNTNYDGLTTYGIHLRVTLAPNPTGLPVGAEVFVGVAHSDVAF